ncbi:MAG TPA: hypothetical protein VL332_02025 [Candidatus Saccharimonadaceae bacterium]|nr:hypothetical protein [Candidatus Saccharimonadaceae bacterium]
MATAQKNGPAAYVLGIDGRILFANRLISPHLVVKEAHWHGHDASLIEEGQDYTIRLFAPLTSEAIQFVEDERHGVDDLQFALELQVRAQEVEITRAPGTKPQRTFGPINWTKPGPNWDPVSFNKWNACLAAMEWRAWELVQIPRVAFESHPRMGGALLDFKRACASHLKGDWPEVLGNSYKSIERLAGGGGSEDKKAAFNRFLLEAFPDDCDADKRSKLDALIFAVSSFCQVGRHAGPSAARKPEAEAVLGMTASLFALLGRALADAHARTQPAS